jgi:hypothetical protein
VPGVFAKRWQRRFWHGQAGGVMACRRPGERLCQRLRDTSSPAPTSRSPGRLVRTHPAPAAACGSMRSRARRTPVLTSASRKSLPRACRQRRRGPGPVRGGLRPLKGAVVAEGHEPVREGRGLTEGRWPTPSPDNFFRHGTPPGWKKSPAAGPPGVAQSPGGPERRDKVRREVARRRACEGAPASQHSPFGERITQSPCRREEARVIRPRRSKSAGGSGSRPRPLVAVLPDWLTTYR